MREEIIANAELIEKILKEDFDVLIKKNKDGSIKVLYYKPRNLKNYKDEQ